MAEKEKERGPGRPEYVPTNENRERVVAMMVAGGSRRAAARMLGIAVETLEKYFLEELEDGIEIFQASLTLSLIRQANGGPAEYDAKNNLLRAEQKPVPVVGIYMSKVHLGWNELIPQTLSRPRKTETETKEKVGKKEQALADAQTAGMGSEWGDDLSPPASRRN